MALPNNVDLDNNARAVWLANASTGQPQTLAAGSTTDPVYGKEIGATSVTTTQANTSISPANALLLVAARSTRSSVTITNITGTQPIYLVNAANATGTTTGFFLAGVAGASITLDTVAAIYGTSPTAAQTVGIIETFG